MVLTHPPSKSRRFFSREEDSTPAPITTWFQELLTLGYLSLLPSHSAPCKGTPENTQG